MASTRSAALDLVALSVLSAGLVYSVSQAVSDLASEGELKSAMHRAEIQVATLDAERVRLQRLIDGLTGAKVDRDLLEATMRRSLGVGRSDEVLLLPPKPVE